MLQQLCKLSAGKLPVEVGVAIGADTHSSFYGAMRACMKAEPSGLFSFVDGALLFDPKLAQLLVGALVQQ